MKRKLLVFTLLFFSIQLSFAQKKSVAILKQEAAQAYENENYELTVSKVNQLSSVFKEVPPQYLAFRIKALNTIVAQNPYKDYSAIETTRNFISSYLAKFAKKRDSYYNSILEIRDVFETYPKSESVFIAKKKANELEEIERKRKAALEAELQRKKILRDNIIRDSLALVNAARAKLKFTQDSLQAIRQADIDRVNNQKAAEQLAKQQKAQAIIDKRNLKAYNFRNNTFSNLGVISGEVAKYGLLFEHGGGRNFLGYHIAARTSLIPKNDIVSGKVVENRTEVDLGPNLKLSNYVYLNLGAGYGFYNYANRNDYASQTPGLEMETYLVTSGGIMIRLGRLINISGGVSFMDIDKGFYKPEITAGLTFNLKSN